ncbi:unnamed protein product [Lasius platythorax]|uniref:Uncharacterized protein n=1 Tax=Lasius platythorax TaxID=488582 RepID=A0AAV2N6D6_9HYME
MAGVNPAGPLRFHYLIKHHSTLNRANTRRSGVGTCIHFSASYKSAYTLGFRTSFEGPNYTAYKILREHLLSGVATGVEKRERDRRRVGEIENTSA